MKRIALILPLLILTLTALAAPPPQRIATVDLEKIFREFYKSKIAEGAIKQQAEIYRGYLLRLQEQIRILENELNVARDSAQNLALDDSTRDKAATTMRQKEQQITAKRTEAEQYATDRNRKMREFELQKRREIIDEIRSEIKRRGVAEGYDFVLDLSGRTMNDVSPILYAAPGCDLTDEVLKTLNATAVTSLPEPDKAKEKKLEEATQKVQEPEKK